MSNLDHGETANGRFRRLLTPVWWGLAVLSPLFLAGFMAIHHVDIPFWDQWELVPFLEKSYEGTLGWKDFLAQHNEHRLLVFYLIWLPLARLTRWNHHAELTLNLLVACAVYGILAWWWRGQMRLLGHRTRPWFWVVLSLVVFSGSQWENWFNGFQLSFFLNILAVTGGLVLLSPPEPGRLNKLLAIAAGLTASFTMAPGFLLWPLGLAQMMSTNLWRKRRWFILTWILSAAVCGAVYFNGYHLSAGTYTLANVLMHPFDYLHWFLNFIGAPVWKNWLAFLPGLAGLLLLAILLPRMVRHLRQHVGLAGPLLGLAIYAVCTGALIGIARVTFGPLQAVTSRYVTISSALWISIVCTLYALPILRSGSREGHPRDLSRWHTLNCRLSKVLIAILAAQISLCSAAGYISSWYWLPWRLGAPREAILAGSTDVRLLGRITPRPELLPHRLHFLKQHRLSLYRGLPQ